MGEMPFIMGGSPQNAADPEDHYQTRSSLLLALKGSDDKPREVAWQEFHYRYAPIIAGFARNMGAKAQEVDDVIQDVMLGFFAVSPRFVYDRAKGRFRGFLKVCTFRALRRRSQHSVASAQYPDGFDPSVPEAEEAWEAAWREAILGRAMSDVSRHYKERGAAQTFEAFEAYAVQHRPAAEVAAALGMSLNSVYKAKERVVEALKRRVGELDAED
jgi:RNA polymerase sigma-70 factor (ECF subfamily)